MRALATMPPKDDDWLHWWVRTYLGFHIPRVQVCEHHVAPFEAFAASYFAREPIVIWEGSRGFSGKSITLSALSLAEQITLGTNIRLLGGSGEQAQRINDYIRGQDPNAQGMFWDAPLAPKHLLGDTTKTEVRTKNGGYVKALMASPTSIRGAHPVRLRIDEVDEMDLKLYDASMGQTMSRNGVAAQTTISSTHHHPDGTMTEVKRRAEEQGFPIYRWCYKETMQPHGWLEPAEVERKRREVPRHMFENEYDLHEPLAEGRIFTPDVLEGLFDPCLGEFEGHAREEIVIVKPDDSRDFYHGTDWGRKVDWTVVHTNKRSRSGPDILAAWTRMQQPLDWPMMVAAHNQRVRSYGGPSSHDETGLGDVVGAYMQVNSEGFDFNRKKERSEMFWSYVASVEAGEHVYPMIKPLYRSHRFVTWDDLFGGGHPPDEFVAAALAWRAREHSTFEIMLGRI